MVLSDDPSASQKIAEFAASHERWMVAVRMVSEGVDIPRLAVGVYATSASDAAVLRPGDRAVRAGPARAGETATVFLPSVPHAAGAGRPRWRASATTSSAGRRRRSSTTSCSPRPSGSATAPSLEDGARLRGAGGLGAFDRVIFDGGEFGTYAAAGSAEEQDFLGLPGLLAPDQVAALLRQRQAQAGEEGPPRSRARAGGGAGVRAGWRRCAGSCRVSSRHTRRAAGGRTPRSTPSYAAGAAARPTAQASEEQLKARMAALASFGA